MITASAARRIALSMPEAEERSHMGHPDFRVGGKIFATLWPKECRAVLKLSVADQTALLQMDPKAFSTNAWSSHGWLNVHLKYVGARAFRDLVRDAWLNAAPKKLLTRIASG